MRFAPTLLTLCLVIGACSPSPDSEESVAAADAVETPASVSASHAPATATTTSELRQRAQPGLKILAHRGVHQTFSLDGVDDETCTATRIDPPTHRYIENTIPSMDAAFEAGASVVELDIARTSDGVLAVFHDWDVGCRTNGSGEIRSLTWDQLSQLDVGYGYTADGETYPLRGHGQGLMPRLEDVFAALPEGRFLINFKSGDPAEAALLREVVEANDAAHQVWAVYGARVAVEAYAAATGARAFTEESIVECLTEYLAEPSADTLVPACRDTVVVAPSDLAPVLPGWPDAFLQRMAEHGADVIISGPGRAGIDTQQAFDLLPQDIDVYVWTNDVNALASAS